MLQFLKEVSQSPVILCRFSGGLDSVGVLYRLLTSSEYEGYDIHVHHMHLLNCEERAEAEGHATQSLYQAFRKICERDFVVTENLVEYRCMKTDFIWDMDRAAFMAANVVRSYPSIKKVAMGRTKTDVADAKSGFSQRIQRAQNVYEELLSLEKFPTPERIFPVLEFTKAEIFTFLPEEIRDLAWSCRQPVYFDDAPPEPCHLCHTCQDLQAMRAELENAS